MSTMEKDRLESQEEGSTSAAEEAPRRSRKGRKSRRSEKSQSGPLDQLPLNNVTDDAVGNVTNTLGGITGGALGGGQEQGGGGKSDTLRLRLDLNLDIEIQLKARIHGDLELALLRQPAAMAEDSAQNNACQHVHRAGPVHDTHMFTIPNPRSKQHSSPSTRDASPKPPRQPSPKPASDAPPKQNSEIKIPKITPVGSSGETPQALAQGLEGKYVDEFGNILDWDGTVLGRVEGDLPSMVGRPVSESGEILDEEGEVAGHVSENYARPPLKPLENGLKVDDAGNIYGEDGKVVGKLNKDSPDSRNDPKPTPAPSPSDIFLDVKSTHDGIQLIIRIPTVFNRECDHPDHS
ncbi:hypothetical protein HJFPF1_04018 [Paramyrothecium foliicola]|nr:hypothetical protein HJFPF1_04018 [Paramyrothecium foliicola]